MEDEEFEKWYNSKETQDIIINELDSDEKKIARLAWQASLDLYRTEECEDCDMKNKLAPCRPPHMCKKFKRMNENI